MILLTIKQTCAQLGISPRTLRNLRDSGAIGYVALDGRKIRHTPEDVADYLASRHKVASVRGEAPECRFTKRKTRPSSTMISSGEVVAFSERQAARASA